MYLIKEKDDYQTQTKISPILSRDRWEKSKELVVNVPTFERLVNIMFGRTSSHTKTKVSGINLFTTQVLELLANSIRSAVQYICS